MQFVITAYDGKDPGALERRMAVRQNHLENILKVKETGSVLCAGGILDEAGRMIGSVLVMDFPTREALDAYLAGEPYITGKVWQEIKIEPCNVVIMKDEKVGK